MKAVTLSLLISFASIYAQITITNSDYSNMFTVGNEFTIRENTGGGTINIGEPGGGNVWDFSWFSGNLEMDISVIDPATSPYINEFPGANIATYSLGEFEGEEGEIWSYSNLSGNLGNLGSAITINSQPGNLITIKYNPPRIEAELPLTFNSSWSETYTQIIYFNGNPFVQSSVSINVIVDAYGTMTLPGGGIFEALRIRESMTIDGQTTVSYTFLSKSGAQVTVNAVSSNPPNSGEIAAESYNWNSEFGGGGGNLNLTVTHPGSDDIVIAGERDSIKYRFYEGDVDLFYSLDEGQNFVLIDSNYNEFGGVYYWDVPDSFLTTKAIIKVVDSSPDTAESALFKIKPWQLTRIANDAFELYELNQDGWNFTNSGVNIWPQNWWEQFDYQSGTDPYTGLPYPPIPPFIAEPDSSFPDWPLFVDIFTVSRCYLQTPVGLMYRPRPMLSWGRISDSWGGSCFGFVVSSLLGFYHKQELVQFIGDFTELFSVPLDDETRYPINYFQMSQFSKEIREYRRINTSKSPRELLNDLKEMFREEDGDGRPLRYPNTTGSGGHAVVPYKLERDSLNLSAFFVRVYNPNNPGNFNQFIYLDSLANIWSDSTSLNFGTGTSDCYLHYESAFFLNTPSLRPSKLSIGDADNYSGLSTILIYNTSNAEIEINSSLGQVGYHDSLAYNYLPGAVPIIPETGYFHPPIGYDLPVHNYSIQINNFSTTDSYVVFETDSTVYGYGRTDADNNDTDLFSYSENGVGIINPDNKNKTIELETIILEDTTSEKVFIAGNVILSSGDSIRMKKVDSDALLINNFGDEMSYDLHIRIVSVNRFNVFEHSAIPMTGNSGHQIVPNWDDLQNSDLKILIDLGNDGTIDDSMFVKNQTTSIEDEGSLLSPDSYNLAQNYPNPFNPSTTIQYSIPQRGNVILKVYDILGNEVAVLVNEEKDKGVYSVSFDAAKFSSGVYFYQLQSGGVSLTKKMLILK